MTRPETLFVEVDRTLLLIVFIATFKNLKGS